MPLFKWYKKYSVNNEVLDNHHKALFDIFNRLFDDCSDPKNVGCLGLVIDEMISYADYHFAAEEQYMADRGYKDLDRHRAKHREFSQKAMQMHNAGNKDDAELIKDTIVFLGDWLLHHVLEEDKKYSI